MNLSHYHVIADLFDYPREGFPEKVCRVLSSLEEYYPDAAEETARFAALLPAEDLLQMQELYTRSFDVQAITTLDVGYVLFGDDYKRGEILSNLNREHQAAGNDCGIELADHLPNLLRLISKLKDAELVLDLVEQIVAPALKKMIDEFDPARVDKKNKLYKKHYKTLIETSENRAVIYSYALKALFKVIKKDFQIDERALKPAVENDFLNSVNCEMTVEKIADE